MIDKAVLPAATKILVAEDSLINRKLLELHFQKQHIVADFVENGLEAVEKLSGTESYSLLLLDIEMPEMNGYETTRHIRMVMKSNIPIVAMSGYSDAQEKERCIQSGMNNYVSKPIDMNLLYSIMNDLIKSVYIQQNVVNESSEEGFDFIDLSYFKTLSGGRPEFELNIYEMLIEDIPLQLSEVISAIDAGQLRDAAQIVHKMKSSLKMIGIQKIEPLVANLEQELNQGKLAEHSLNDLAEIQTTVNSAMAELTAVHTQLRRQLNR